MRDLPLTPVRRLVLPQIPKPLSLLLPASPQCEPPNPVHASGVERFV
jgi:hypothetical protein